MTAISDRRKEYLLAGIKVDLQIQGSVAYDDRLCEYIDAAVQEIERQGATLTEETAENNSIIQSYVCWRWRTRDTMSGMPRALRFSINNLVFSQHAKTGGDANGL